MSETDKRVRAICPIVGLLLLSGCETAPVQPPAAQNDAPGTVLASVLDPVHFAAVMKDPAPATWSIDRAKGFKWVLADGRRVPATRYHSLTNHERVPDLRGRFLRGMNYDHATAGLPPDIPGVEADPGADPDPSRTPFTRPQASAFRSHSHAVSGEIRDAKTGSNVVCQLPHDFEGRHLWILMGPPPGPGNGIRVNAQEATLKDAGLREGRAAPGGATQEYESGHETRPVNVAVYYYIRVN